MKNIITILVVGKGGKTSPLLTSFACLIGTMAEDLLGYGIVEARCSTYKNAIFESEYHAVVIFDSHDDNSPFDAELEAKHTYEDVKSVNKRKPTFFVSCRVRNNNEGRVYQGHWGHWVHPKDLIQIPFDGKKVVKRILNKINGVRISA